MLGWEPSERHEHYDAEGNLSGYTVVTREAEFNDADQIGLLALQRYESEVHACGHHASLLADKSNFFEPATHVCAVCAAKDRWDRMLRDSDATAIKGLGPKDPYPSDGRSTYTRLLSPEEVAERQSKT